QAEDGIRDLIVTGVQTCALPICDNQSSIIHLWRFMYGGSGRSSVQRWRSPVAEPKAAKHSPSKSEGKPRRKKRAAAEPRSRGIRSEERRVGKEGRSRKARGR